MLVLGPHLGANATLECVKSMLLISFLPCAFWEAAREDGVHGFLPPEGDADELQSPGLALPRSDDCRPISNNEQQTENFKLSVSASLK